MPAPQRNIEYQVYIAEQIKQLRASGVKLTAWERQFLKDFRLYRRPTQRQYKILFDLFRKGRGK
jgi:hypothetical protein